jgi:hypothetical protein
MSQWLRRSCACSGTAAGTFDITEIAAGRKYRKRATALSGASGVAGATNAGSCVVILVLVASGNEPTGGGSRRDRANDVPMQNENGMELMIHE